ncbi:GGDEF domain-containing protein [Polymorphospora sp. NPDC050346]|uniref:GGDEF domain-containing protein n=1 Tax=Polymorphospora sp. NPDC050346 TaxID=3155780 RepID=UPI0033D0BABC
MTVIAPDPLLILATLASLLAGAAGLLSGFRSSRLLADARHAATHDRLTGLPNRLGLADAWANLAGHRRHVVVLDLDGFKPVNDQYGHAAGDFVLATIGARLAANAIGTAARLGGDEFAVIVTADSPTTHARRLAAVIAAPIHLPPTVLANPTATPAGVVVTVTASIGLAPARSGLAVALAAADAAMYRAKTARLGVTVHDPAADDDTTPTGTRPTIRTRDLTTEDDVIPAEVIYP